MAFFFFFQEKLHELRRQRKREAAKKSSKGTSKTRRRSTIRLDAKVQNVKDLRAGQLLSIFAEHFLDMARASNEHRAYPQAYMYLLLAGNMATLLDENSHSDKASDYRRKIVELNVASRGGVQDMLGSSWTMTSTHDLMPSTPSLRGSNWELQPVPQPPPKPSPISVARRNKLTSLTNFEKQPTKKISTPDKNITQSNDTDTTQPESPEKDSSSQPNGTILVFTDDEDDSTDL